MFTVEQIREDVAPFVGESGKCPDSPQVLDYINQARRLLWPRGDWRGTVETVCIESFDGFLTLPYDYLRISDAKVCGGFSSIDTEWYEVVDNGRIDQSCFSRLIDIGDKFASFRDYYVDNRPATHRVRIMAENNGDQGKSISFGAIGEMGNRVTLVNEIGDDHVKVSFNPWIKYFRTASKEATIGRVRVYIWDPNRGTEQLCAIYEADDLTPQYRRYKTSSCQGKFFYCRCKKRYRKLLRETDPVEFNTDALMNAMIAINARRAKEYTGYQTAMTLATDNLNHDHQDAQPVGQERMRLTRGKRVENLNQMGFCPHRLE